MSPNFNLPLNLSIGDVSKEFCGGTHVSNTKDIGCFVIESEESVASGVRRIVARTSIGAYELLKKFYEARLFNGNNGIAQWAQYSLGLVQAAKFLNKYKDLKISRMDTNDRIKFEL